MQGKLIWYVHNHHVIQATLLVGTLPYIGTSSYTMCQTGDLIYLVRGEMEGTDKAVDDVSTECGA